MSKDVYPGAFQQLVFSGGGARCFWHGGFLEAVAGPLDLAPQRVTGVSGGALAAACYLGGRERELLEIMGAKFQRNDSNTSLVDDEHGDGLTPHQRIYREVVRETLDPDAEARVADGPGFQVLVAFPPWRRHPRASTVPLTLAYGLDLWLRSSPYMRFTKLAGVRSELIDAREAARRGKLVDLICNAAVIPPVFNLEGWEGTKVVDGGLACKAPQPEPDRGRTLVLLTRRFRNLPSHPDRVYAEVSDETHADKLDFTDRSKIEATWRQGTEDGRRFLERHGIGA
ncbi:patatin-like phospholipase family protein [Botrimarina sp.]|uniref:patatin-like phospholipase family protein n=1 Tax=Botrimarina sp. TaxID=2795802 RepID=UPI0032F07A04